MRKQIGDCCVLSFLIRRCLLLLLDISLKQHSFSAKLAIFSAQHIRQTWVLCSMAAASLFD